MEGGTSFARLLGAPTQRPIFTEICEVGIVRIRRYNDVYLDVLDYVAAARFFLHTFAIVVPAN